MVEKGYSQTISNKVLQELDSRANEISSTLMPSTSLAKVQRKRYSGIHRPLFSKMESISSHYAASRAQNDALNSSPTRDFPSSATKKRRTLNGPEEIFGSDKENESPSRRKGPFGYVNMTSLDSKTPFVLGRTLLPAPTLKPGPEHVSLLRSSPVQDHSPSRIPVAMSSPLKFTKISPSKGSMNLNLLLHEDDFVKPSVPKHRQSSLEMAGVDTSGARHGLRPGASLQKKPSIPTLQKKSSIPTLQKKPSIPPLQKKPSIPTLQKKVSVTNLQKGPSVLNLQKKPSAPSLQKKPSVPLFSHPQQKLPNHSSVLSFKTLPSHTSTHSMRSFHKPSMNNVTVPQPFSLYDRPTISSSQKSLDIPPSSSARSLNTLQGLASQRLLNRFQKFKSRFS